MKDVQKRIETLAEVTDKWLSDDNQYLLQAAEQTVEEDYFSLPDVKFALKVLRDSLTKEALEEWISRSGLTDKNDARGENVLCLHAGNLPLVGFQDALAVLLSGARYTGKISRKDPYLLPTFLNEVKKTEIWSDVDVQWSHRLDDFAGMQNDAILFAGSEQSVPQVKTSIERLNLKKRESDYLIRTAHFSMAYLDEKNEETIQDLTEAVLRYGGKGCRSVAVVVSPFPFESLRDELRRAFDNFWKENPQHQKPAPKLKQRFAYNKAIERKQLWLEYFLLQQGGLELDQDFICYWKQGDEATAAELANRFGAQLQSIYVNDMQKELPGFNGMMESLVQAQRPPVWWQPDGTDILKWLCRRKNV